MSWHRGFAILLVTTLALALPSLSMRAADWPYRAGPYRNNSTTEVVPPWTEPLKAEWQIPLGEGYSSPTVAERKLFIHSKVKGKYEEEVLAFDAETGKQLWRHSYTHKPFESDVGNGPRFSPAIVRGKVYAFGITGILTCLEAETGKPLWQVNPLEKYEAPIMMFGCTAGPLIEGNRLFLPVGKPGSCLVALDTETGTPLWNALNDSPTSVTPALFTPKVAGRGIVRHLIYTSTRGFIGVDPQEGKILWEYPLADNIIGTIPPPTVVGDVFVVSSMLTGTFAVKLEDQEGQLVPKEAWRNPRVTTYFTQNVAGAGGKLYALNATLIPQAEIALSCLDLKDGKEIWKRPKIGLYQLNMIRTGDDKLLMLDDIKGDLILLDTAADEYRELARGKVCNPTIISPALANGRLYTRDDKGTSCYRVGAVK